MPNETGASTAGSPTPGPPPLALPLDGESPASLGVLGRRKWAVAGGYPTLSHGGISLLEMLVPFIELETT